MGGSLQLRAGAGLVNWGAGMVSWRRPGSNWPLKESIGFPMTFLYLGTSSTHDARAADRPVTDLAELCVNIVGALRLLLGHTLLGLEGT